MLDNPRSDRVRQVAALSGRSVRKRTGRLLVEGPQAVRELVRFRAETLVDLYFTPAAAARHEELYAEARAETRWVHTVSDEVSERMSRDGQGVVAVAEASAIGVPPNQVRALFDRVSVNGGSNNETPFSVLIPQMQDPGNVGTIIRSADAMGARAVFLMHETADPSNPKVIRASAGSVFHLPIVRVKFSDAVAELKQRGVEVIGTAVDEQTQLLEDWIHLGSAGPLGAAHAWVFGNESRGLSAAERASCDRLVEIAMSDNVESLNAAAAAAICMHASSFVSR